MNVQFYQLADISEFETNDGQRRFIPLCLLRRTETTTAQRPYQGGFTIRNKLNNVSQISKEVLKFVGKLMGGSCLTVV